MNETDKIRDFEARLLHSAYISESVLDDIIFNIKKPEYFQIPQHQEIYKALQKIQQQTITPDVLTVIKFLEEDGRLEKAGGRAYVAAEIMSDAPCGDHNYYINKIVDAYRLRTINSQFKILASQANNVDADPKTVINSAEKVLLDITSTERSEYKSVAELTMPTCDSILSENIKDSDQWIESRIAGLNRLITGLFRGDVVVIAAAPSMGKTMFALDTCIYNLKWQRKTHYVSLDQSKEAIIYRMLSSLTGFSKTELLKGGFNQEQKDSIAHAGALLATYGDFTITDNSDLTVLDIRSQCRRIKRTNGLDVLVVDYIQQIPPHGKFGNRHLEITDISRILKQIAKELNIVVLVLSQLTKEFGKGLIDEKTNSWNFPQTWMLRESGTIEQDANVIIFPHVPYELLKKKYGENSLQLANLLNDRPDLRTKAFLVVAKNKDGETGVIDCARDVKRMRFYTQQPDLPEQSKIYGGTYE